MSDTTNSQPITWAEAQNMQNAYLVNPAALKTEDGSGGYATLKGFRIDVQAIQNIIAGINASGNPVQNLATEIFVFFGVCPADLPKPAADQCFTTIFAGIDANNELQQNVIYDYSNPCPNKCPTIS